MKCEIEGVIIRELVCHRDERGWLVELFRHDELESHLLPAMSYLSMTSPGFTRGPHEHVEQTDIFCFVGPSLFRLYLWDNRSSAVTFQKSCRLELGETAPTMVIVPPGVVHAYRNIGPSEALVFNAPNRLFRGPGRVQEVDEIRHEDDPQSPFRID